MKCLYLFVLVVLLSCQQKENVFTKELWQVVEQGQAIISLGDVLAFEADQARVRNKFTGSVYALPWLPNPLKNTADSFYYLVPTYDKGPVLKAALYQGDRLVGLPMTLQPATPSDTATAFCLPRGVTYALSFLDTMLYLSTQSYLGGDLLEEVHLREATFSFQEKEAASSTHVISAKLNAHGFLEMGVISLNPTKSGLPTMLYSCGCAVGQDPAQERLVLHCLVEPPSAKTASAGLYATKKESWERTDTLVLEKLPPRIPPSVSDADILALLNRGRIEVVDNLATLGSQEVNYTDRADFLDKGGIFYKELNELSFDFSPTGLFTLSTLDRVLLEGQWQLAADRRYVYLRQKKGKSLLLPIIAYEKDKLELAIHGLQVATPENFGEQLMSFARTALVFKVFQE